MSLRTAVVCDGSFTVAQCQWDGVENHCGIDASSVRFKVTVEGELDARGFVIDVRDPRDYFNRVYTEGKAPLVSCESIAAQAVDYFRKLAHKPLAVSVEIQASAYGFARCDWRIS